MDLSLFLECVKTGTIPDSPPDGLASGGYRLGLSLNYFDARTVCNRYGMWAIVDKVWTKELANWVGNRKVLEIMAGAGWLARALSDYGVEVVATDDYSWDKENHKQMRRVYPVTKLHALEAIATIKADVLLVSWPPYGDDTVYRAMRLWGTRKPIVYIGEPEGGCNAPDLFFEEFKPIRHPVFPLVCWDGIHDGVMIGKWKGENK